MKFLHVMIRVNDLEKSMTFYTKLFGMSLAKTLRLEDCTLYFLSDDEGYTQIELTDNDVKPEGGYTNGTSFGHFAFEVPSIEEFTKQLHALGYEYLYESFYMSEVKTNIAFIKDPDGNEIELIEHKKA